MSVVLTIHRNGTTTDFPHNDKWAAIADAMKIRGMPHTIEATVAVDGVVVCWVSHSPMNNRGEKWRM